MNKSIICVDFDGVIHSYEKGWQNGEIYGRAVPGFFEWYFSVWQTFDIQIYSSRSKDDKMLYAMKEWLQAEYESWLSDLELDFEYPRIFPAEFAHEKPAAFITIDDRAIQFNGDWEAQELSVSALKDFKPWTNIYDRKGGASE